MSLSKMEDMVGYLYHDFRRKLTKVCGLVALVGGGYAGYKMYQHFHNRESLNNIADHDDSGDMHTGVNYDQPQKHVEFGETTISLFEPGPSRTRKVESSDEYVSEDIGQTKTFPFPLKKHGRDKISFNVRSQDLLEFYEKMNPEEIEDHEFLTAVNNLQNIGRIIFRSSNREEDIFNSIAMSTKLLYIQDDAFSLLRAVAIQNLVCGTPLVSHIGGINGLIKKFRAWFGETEYWLQHWCFYGIGILEIDNFFEFFHECFATLQSLEDVVNNEEFSITELLLLCKDPLMDNKLIEAMKLIMMASAIELFKQKSNCDIVPVFSSLLFSIRKISSPQDLMYNHFNLLGYSNKLRKIDFYLLGYSMKQTIVIAQPHLYGTKDFVKRYPECMIGIWPEVVIVMNENGQYCILGK